MIAEAWYSGRILHGPGVADPLRTPGRGSRELVLCAPSCLAAFGLDPAAPSVIVPRSTDLADAETLAAGVDPGRWDALVGIGAGSVMDVAKLVASRSGIPLTAVPTVLSCNAFATQYSVLRVGGRGETVRTCAPRTVLVDPLVLDRADRRWHLLGVLEALSVDTALYDWELAVEAGAADRDPLTAGLAGSLRDWAFAQLEVLCAGPSELVYREVLRMLVVSAHLTTLYGSGRPESGSEHRIARVIESVDLGPGKLWHGEAVLVGMLLATALQERPNRRLYTLAEHVGLGARLRERGLDTAALADCLRRAFHDRPSRFTVLDTATPGAERAKDLTDDLGRRLGTTHGAGGAVGGGRR